MNISAFKPANGARRFAKKKQVEIPMELDDKIYHKLAEHQRAFDYLANRYKMSYGFTKSAGDKAYVICARKADNSGATAWSKNEIAADDDFATAARSIYKLADEVLSMTEGEIR